MAPSYQSLPAELLSRVAELVHEQDLALVKPLEDGSISRAISPPDPEYPDCQDDIEQGAWSYWCGRGVKAMAQVDRVTRAAALPYLYKSVTAKQTDTLYFRYEVLGERPAELVRHVRNIDHDKQAASLACALRKLPNLTSIHVGRYALHKLFAHEALEDKAILQDALRSTLGKITALEVSVGITTALCNVFRGVSGASLRKLCLQPCWWPEVPDAELASAARELVGLVELELGTASNDTLDAMRRDVEFPTVRSVVLDTRTSFEQDVLFVHHVTPTVARLIVRNRQGFPSHPSLATLLPNPLLPTLRSLVVEADAYLPIFHELELGALEHFKVSVENDFDEFPLDVDEVPFKMAPLRTITLAFRAAPEVKASKAVQRLCKSAGVRLVVEKSPPSIRELKIRVVEDAHDKGIILTVDDSKHSTVVDTLDWARRRADWLYDIKDGPGLHELANATVRLHEQYLMDRV